MSTGQLASLTNPNFRYSNSSLMTICSRFRNTTATNRREGDALEDMSHGLVETSQLGAQDFILNDSVDHPFFANEFNADVSAFVILSRELRCDAAGRRTRDSSVLKTLWMTAYSPPSALAVAVPKDLASIYVENSQVVFYPRGGRLLSPVTGNIQHIYATPTCELVLAVHRHLPLDRRDHHRHVIDPFAVYPDFPAKSSSSSLSGHLENVKVFWVTSHFTQWDISSDPVVIISLLRVNTIILEMYQHLTAVKQD
ncbi:hypothetical protein AZE42_11342 [Rhizopogon vesiculosus]|uniref:Uncharacterized protein n=1 Tax=Rhizopogon vesiculosus TaxID=180088 RepID=A0A1J8QKC9_9AGAM|nr:hypothetical protein AZE42_11342 [Rhizopogon vesiculosus]